MNGTSAQAGHVAGLSQREKRALLGSLLQSQAATVVPASFAQRRLWLVHQVHSATPVYNVRRAVQLEGRLNVAALEQTLRELQRRHDALRTTIMALKGDLVQVTSRQAAWTMSFEDLSPYPRRLSGCEIERRARAVATRPFDLER